MGFGRKRPSDAELLEYLFVTYRNRMYGIAFSVLHDEMQAEDAVGDAFERLIPYLGRCRTADGEKVKHLLARLAKHAAIDIYRKNKRAPIQGLTEQIETDENNPEDVYVQEVFEQEQVALLKEMLPAHYWSVIRLRYMEDMTVKEIAGRLGLTEENVYSRLRRARKCARELLEKTG